MARWQTLVLGTGILVGLIALPASQAGSRGPLAPPPPLSFQMAVAQDGTKFVPLSQSELGAVRMTLTDGEQTIQSSEQFGPSQSFGFAYLGSYTPMWHPHGPTKVPAVPAYVIQITWYAPGESASGGIAFVDAVDGRLMGFMGPCTGSPDCLYVRPLPSPSPIPTPVSWSALERPLNLPVLAAGTPCPRSRGQTVSSAYGPVLGAGPIYPVMGSAGTLGVVPSDGSYLQKVLWVGAASYHGPVVIRGGRLDRPGWSSSPFLVLLLWMSYAFRNRPQAASTRSQAGANGRATPTSQLSAASPIRSMAPASAK